MSHITRRDFVKNSALAAAGIGLAHRLSFPMSTEIIYRAIPSTGEKIPVIGLGSWITFDVGNSAAERSPMREVLRQFAQMGGKVVDSSPMYRRSEQVIGELAAELKLSGDLWFVTKVWTTGEESGKGQIRNSTQLFGQYPKLLQVHNLVDFNTHIKTLRRLKEEGKIKYAGITHYVDSAHEDVKRILKAETLDFVQINLSIRGRKAEDSLIPLAVDRGVAVIINQPFETGALFRAVGKAPLPAWAKEWEISTWAAYFLKYIVSNPAVTCTIPATSQVAHLKENMAALSGPLPDAKTRQKMIEYFKNL